MAAAQVILLQQELHAGSRALGDALVHAGELQELGNFRKAALVLTSFLERCSAPFYRGIALSRLADIERHNGT